MANKVNPRKKVCTQADMKKAVVKATEMAVRQAIKMVLYILVDKHDAPLEEVQQLSDELKWLAQNLDERRMSWSDVDRVLKDLGLKIDWINNNG